MMENLCNAKECSQRLMNNKQLMMMNEFRCKFVLNEMKETGEVARVEMAGGGQQGARRSPSAR
jgi:hypothetical protein